MRAWPAAPAGRCLEARRAEIPGYAEDEGEAVRQAIGERKLRAVSRRFGRPVLEVLVRGGSPHGCGWARFEGCATQVWIDWAQGRYLSPWSGAELPTLEQAAADVAGGPPPPLSPTPAQVAFFEEVRAGLLARMEARPCKT